MDMFASLSAFQQVIEEGSFAAAGRKLGLSRSQVSKLVVSLEDRLGVQLLTRTTRSVAPTPAGEAFYQRAEAILNDLSEAVTCLQDDQDEPQGMLRINAPTSFGVLYLGQAIAAFMTRYPKIKVQMHLSDQYLDPMENGFDLTLRITTPFETLSMIDHKITAIEHVYCAAPSYLEGRAAPQTLQDLNNHQRLSYAASGLPKSSGTESQFSANNGDVIRDMAVAGHGIAYLPLFIVGQDIAEGRLLRVLNDHAADMRFLYILYAPHRHLSARIRLFVEFMYEIFGETPPWDNIVSK